MNKEPVNIPIESDKGNQINRIRQITMTEASTQDSKTSQIGLNISNQINEVDFGGKPSLSQLPIVPIIEDLKSETESCYNQDSESRSITVGGGTIGTTTETDDNTFKYGKGMIFDILPEFVSNKADKGKYHLKRADPDDEMLYNETFIKKVNLEKEIDNWEFAHLKNKKADLHNVFERLGLKNNVNHIGGRNYGNTKDSNYSKVLKTLKDFNSNNKGSQNYDIPKKKPDDWIVDDTPRSRENTGEKLGYLIDVLNTAYGTSSTDLRIYPRKEKKKDYRSEASIKKEENLEQDMLLGRSFHREIMVHNEEWKSKERNNWIANDILANKTSKNMKKAKDFKIHQQSQSNSSRSPSTNLFLHNKELHDDINLDNEYYREAKENLIENCMKNFKCLAKQFKLGTTFKGNHDQIKYRIRKDIEENSLTNGRQKDFTQFSNNELLERTEQNYQILNDKMKAQQKLVNINYRRINNMSRQALSCEKQCLNFEQERREMDANIYKPVESKTAQFMNLNKPKNIFDSNSNNTNNTIFGLAKHIKDFTRKSTNKMLQSQHTSRSRSTSRQTTAIADTNISNKSGLRFTFSNTLARQDSKIYGQMKQKTQTQSPKRIGTPSNLIAEINEIYTEDLKALSEVNQNFFKVIKEKSAIELEKDRLNGQLDIMKSDNSYVKHQQKIQKYELCDLVYSIMVNDKEYVKVNGLQKLFLILLGFVSETDNLKTPEYLDENNIRFLTKLSLLELEELKISEEWKNQDERGFGTYSTGKEIANNQIHRNSLSNVELPKIILQRRWSSELIRRSLLQRKNSLVLLNDRVNKIMANNLGKTEAEIELMKRITKQFISPQITSKITDSEKNDREDEYQLKFKRRLTKADHKRQKHTKNYFDSLNNIEDDKEELIDQEMKRLKKSFIKVGKENSGLEKIKKVLGCYFGDEIALKYLSMIEDDIKATGVLFNNINIERMKKAVNFKKQQKMENELTKSSRQGSK